MQVSIYQYSIVVDEETKPRYFQIKRSRKYFEGWIIPYKENDSDIYSASEWQVTNQEIEEHGIIDENII